MSTSTVSPKTRPFDDSDPVWVLMPVYNDWDAVRKLLRDIDNVAHQHELRLQLLLVDDGSVSAPRPEDLLSAVHSLVTIDILHLARNMGHQRAIAVGLAYLQHNARPSAVLVMDCDGEDSPADIARLVGALRANRSETIVFARRSKRSEGIVFRTGYRVYQLVHWILTGQRIHFGNFSIIPGTLLVRLVVASELWNHFPAAVLKAKLPWTTIDCVRSIRLSGYSRMNLIALVIHGLSAISVFGDVVGVRALIGLMMLMLLSVVAMTGAVVVRFATDLAIPGWATYTVGLLAVILLQSFALSIVFVFMILQSRSGTTVVPLRDFEHLIVGVCHVYPQASVRSIQGA